MVGGAWWAHHHSEGKLGLGAMAQVVEHLDGNHKALSSNANAAKTKNNSRKKTNLHN